MPEGGDESHSRETYEKAGEMVYAEVCSKNILPTLTMNLLTEGISM